MLLARQYNLFPGINDLSGLGLLLADYDILGRLINAENEAIDRKRKESERIGKMPGVTRIVSKEERSEQLRAMKKS